MRWNQSWGHWFISRFWIDMNGLSMLWVHACYLLFGLNLVKESWLCFRFLIQERCLKLRWGWCTFYTFDTQYLKICPYHYGVLIWACGLLDTPRVAQGPPAIRGRGIFVDMYFLPKSCKWNMDPSNVTFLSFRAMFHFHDRGERVFPRQLWSLRSTGLTLEGN